MNTSEIKKDTLKLEPIGTDFWSRPVYKDQHGHLYGRPSSLRSVWNRKALAAGYSVMAAIR